MTACVAQATQNRTARYGSLSEASPRASRPVPRLSDTRRSCRSDAEPNKVAQSVPLRTDVPVASAAGRRLRGATGAPIIQSRAG
jgi:hypothetical protein